MTGQVDTGFAFLVGDRQSATGTDAMDRVTHLAGHPVHHLTDLGQVFQVGSRPDVHVQPGNRDLVAGSTLESFLQLFMPDAML